MGKQPVDMLRAELELIYQALFNIVDDDLERKLDAKQDSKQTVAQFVWPHKMGEKG